MRAPRPSARSRVLLASLEIGPAVTALAPARIVFVPTAANGLPDRQAVVDLVREQLVAATGGTVTDHDLDSAGDPGLPDLGPGDLLVVGGGNPYHLLRAMRRSGFDRTVAAVLARGADYLGVSAGALVAGPSLEPLAGVSPFARPDGLPVAALGLAPLVVLPHDDRPGRHELHREARSQFASRYELVPLRDRELVVVEPDRSWHLLDLSEPGSTDALVRPPA